jgi:hypothetical protein
MLQTFASDRRPANQEIRVMNRLISCVVGLAAFGVAAAAMAQDTADISGAWVVTVDAPQGKNDVEATFKQAGEKVTGEVTTPMGAASFSGTLVNNRLAISYSIPLQGQALEFKLAGVVDHDTMSGTLELGGLGKTSWSARRKPAASAAAPVAPAPAAATAATGSLTDVTGRWNVIVTMAQGSLPLSATLRQDGDLVSGSIKSPLGDVPVAGTMAGSTLKLEFKTATPQGEIVVSMSGELGPNGLSGKSAIAGLGESDWVGTRVQE